MAGGGENQSSGYQGAPEPEIMACMYFEDLLLLGQLQLPEVRTDFLSGKIVPLYALQALLRILDEFHALIMPSWRADPCERQAQQRSAGSHMSQVFAGCKRVVEFPSGCCDGKLYKALLPSQTNLSKVPQKPGSDIHCPFYMNDLGSITAEDLLRYALDLCGCPCCRH